MFSSAAKLASGLDPAPVLTVGSLGQTPRGFFLPVGGLSRSPGMRGPGLR